MAENKRKFVGFIGGSYRDNNPRYNCQETYNYYCQGDTSGSAKEQQVAGLLQRPGLAYLQTLGLPFRPGGFYPLSNSNAAIIVAGNQVFQITGGSGSPINITGTLGTSSGPVSISDNGGYVVIVDGTTTFYTFEIGDTTLTSGTDPHYYGASQVTYQDGIWVFAEPNTPNMFVSLNAGPQGGTGGGPLAFGEDNYGVKQGYADIIKGLISNGRELFIFGTQTSEVWVNEGASGVQPFVRQDGKNSQIGCISNATIVQLAGTIFWLGQNPQGGAVVYYMNGYTPDRVSTHAVEQQLNSLGDLTESYAYGIQYEGHYFYVLQAQGSDFTWVYDVSGVTETNPNPGNWVKWTTTNTASQQVAFAGIAHCFLNGQHLIGDVEGNIYAFDKTVATDNGLFIRRVRQTPHVSKDLNNIFYHLLQVDFLAGQGLVNDGVNPENAVEPKAVLECSDDGGQTWGGPIYAPLGAIGQYNVRARWQQLGCAYDRVFRVIVTDPVIAHVVVAELDFEVGNA